MFASILLSEQPFLVSVNNFVAFSVFLTTLKSSYAFRKVERLVFSLYALKDKFCSTLLYRLKTFLSCKKRRKSKKMKNLQRKTKLYSTKKIVKYSRQVSFSFVIV